MESPIAQFRRLIPVFAAVYVPVAMVLGSLFLVWLAGGDISSLTRDPLAVVETELLKIQRNPDAGIHDLAELHLPFYVGAVSNLGVLLWCATAAICFFACATGRQRQLRYPAGLFLWAALISSVFMLDDLFLLHERALPDYFGISEIWLFGLYALLMAGFVLRYFKEILASEYLLLGSAFGFFAVSLGVDLIPNAIPQPHFFEDGAKLAGIGGWAAYHIRKAAATEQNSRSA